MIEKAKCFAHHAHNLVKQVRKYSGLPYWVHTDEVAEIVAGVTDDPEIIAAAHLHDVAEDVNVEIYTLQGIKNLFGWRVASLVDDLTDVYTKQNYPRDNRAARKRMEADRLSLVHPDAQTIKYADFLSNTKDILVNDPGFAEVYMDEKATILSRMTQGNKILFDRAYNLNFSIIESILNKK